MRRKRLVSLFLVVVLVLALVPASVFAEEKMVVNGDVEFLNPVFNVILPTDLSFKVDPFSVLNEGQIVSPGYAVVNRSPMAIQVSVNAAIKEASAGLWNVKTSAADVNLSDPTITTHDVYLTAQAAETAPVIATTTFAYQGDPAQGANITTGGTMTWTASPSSLDYATVSAVALSKATDKAFAFIVNKSGNTTVKTTVTGSTIEYSTTPTLASDDAIAFKFAGAINPYADGLSQANDQFDIVGTFTFSALTPEGYAAQAAKLVAGTHGFLGGAGGGSGSMSSQTVTLPVTTAPKWTIDSKYAASTISSVNVYENDKTTVLTPISNAAMYSKTATQFSIVPGAGLWGVTVKGKTYYVNVVYNNGTEWYQLKINN